MEPGSVGDPAHGVAVLAIRPRDPFAALAMAPTQRRECGEGQPARPRRNLGTRLAGLFAKRVAERLAAENIRARQRVPRTRAADPIGNEAAIIAAPVPLAPCRIAISFDGRSVLLIQG